MANTAVTTAPASTAEVPTIAEREEHPISALGDSPVTSRQRELIDNTWKLVEGDLQGAGNMLFQRIFEIAPQAIQLFPKFRDVPVSERENDENFRAHALQVMDAVGLAVSSLDDIPSLCLVLKDLGSVHCTHGVQDPHFEIVGQALLWTLEKGLGEENFTPEVKDAWATFYDLVSTEMKEGLHEASKIRNMED